MNKEQEMKKKKKDKGYVELSEYDFSPYVSIPNLSKKRRFMERMYDVYDLPKDKGNYLNTWFLGNAIHNKEKICVDEFWTVKRVNEDTACGLYDRKVNPISINIWLYWKDNTKNVMKAQIHSIDDSSFGVWFNDKGVGELVGIRVELMKWINQFKEIDGEEFLKKCVELGADKETINYD